MDFFLAPLLALFDIRFYRKIRQASLWRGFFYLLYISLIASFLYLNYFSARVLPLWQDLGEWAAGQMPSLQWTPQGLQMDKPSPYTMIHPNYGNLAVFDITKKEATLDEIGDFPVYVTSEKFYIHQKGRAELRVFDLRKQFESNENKVRPEDMQLNPDKVRKFLSAVWPVFKNGIFFFALPTFFIWKLLAALFYSLIGLIMNEKRAAKLSYGQILNLTLFAITPTIWTHFIFLWLRGTMQAPLGLVGNLLIIGIYMMVIFKNLEPRDSRPEAAA